MFFMKNYVFIATILLLSVLTFFSSTQAAIITIVSNKYDALENEYVTATVKINTEGTAINNIDGVISFPSDLMEVTSISTGGSILSLWVEQPTFSNSQGIISFNGGIPNPGYIGSNGTVLNATIRMKKSGTAALAFQTVSARANDGSGTDVTKAVVGASIIVSPAIDPVVDITPKPEPVKPVRPALQAVSITSPTAPDQDAWYALTETTLTWTLPAGVTGVQTLLDRKSNSVPTVTTNSPLKSRKLTDLPEGISYFHIRYRVGTEWSPITHRKIQIDTTKPEEIGTELVFDDKDTISLTLSGFDELSGIQKYAVILDDVISDDILADENGNASYSFPPTSPGTKSVVVKAFDRAGNFLERKISVTFPEISAPTITEYPHTITKGESFEIKGYSPLANASISLWIREDNGKVKQVHVKTAEDKSFTYTVDYSAAEYEISIWAETIKPNGERSAPSEHIHIVVKKPLFVVGALKAIDYLSVAIPLGVLILVFITLISLIIHRVRKIKNTIRKDLTITEKEVHMGLARVNEAINTSISLIEQAGKDRALTEAETNTLKSLSKYIDTIDQYVGERMDDIKKNDL